MDNDHDGIRDFLGMLEGAGIKVTVLDFPSVKTEYYEANTHENIMHLQTFQRVAVAMDVGFGYHVIFDREMHSVSFRHVNHVSAWNFFREEWVDMAPETDSVCIEEYRRNPTFQMYYDAETGTVYVWEYWAEPKIPGVQGVQ